MLPLPTLLSLPCTRENPEFIWLLFKGTEGQGGVVGCLVFPHVYRARKRCLVSVQNAGMRRQRSRPPSSRPVAWSAHSQSRGRALGFRLPCRGRRPSGKGRGGPRGRSASPCACEGRSARRPQPGHRGVEALQQAAAETAHRSQQPPAWKAEVSEGGGGAWTPPPSLYLWKLRQGGECDLPNSIQLLSGSVGSGRCQSKGAAG